MKLYVIVIPENVGIFNILEHESLSFLFLFSFFFHHYCSLVEKHWNCPLFITERRRQIAGAQTELRGHFDLFAVSWLAAGTHTVGGRSKQVNSVCVALLRESKHTGEERMVEMKERDEESIQTQNEGHSLLQYRNTPCIHSSCLCFFFLCFLQLFWSPSSLSSSFLSLLYFLFFSLYLSFLFFFLSPIVCIKL